MKKYHKILTYLSDQPCFIHHAHVRTCDNQQYSMVLAIPITNKGLNETKMQQPARRVQCDTGDMMDKLSSAL